MQEDPGVAMETGSSTSDECERVGTRSGSYRDQNRCGKRGKSYRYGQRSKKLRTPNGMRNGLGTVMRSEPVHKKEGQALLPHTRSGSSTSCFLPSLLSYFLEFSLNFQSERVVSRKFLGLQ